MADLKKAYLSNWIKGANQSVSPLLMDDDSLKVQNGIVTSYRLGAMLKDTGYSRHGGVIQASKSITGLFDSRETPSIKRLLATIDDSTSDDTQLFYDNAGTWTEIAAAETAWANFAGINVEMENFIGFTFFVGYGATDGFLPVGSLTNTTFSTSTNVTSMPTAKYIKRYRDRLYVANCKVSGTAYPYRVYFSSVPSAGAITWDTTLDYIEVDYSEEITGIAAAWDYLVIFTTDSFYYYNQASKKKLWSTGCVGQRTIQQTDSYLIWCSQDGVYVSANLGRPQNISGNVIDFIRSGTPSNFKSALVDEEYHLFVGNVSVDGVGYTNVLLTFNFPTSSWRWRELADEMTILAKYNSSGVNRLYMGDTAGQVWNKGKFTDATLVCSDGKIDSTEGAAISVNIETKPYAFGDPSVRKNIKKVTVFAERAIGAQLKLRAYDTNTRALSPYQSLGQLTKYINVFDGLDLEANLLQFGITESSKNEYFSILGMVVEYAEVAIPNTSRK